MPASFVKPKMICPDGFTVSVQASGYHYCTPRENDGPYTTKELGYPSEPWPDYILPFAENEDGGSPSVAGYVPVELIHRWLSAHGGTWTIEEVAR